MSVMALAGVVACAACATETADRFHHLRVRRVGPAADIICRCIRIRLTDCVAYSITQRVLRFRSSLPQLCSPCTTGLVPHIARQGALTPPLQEHWRLWLRFKKAAVFLISPVAQETTRPRLPQSVVSGMAAISLML